MNIGKSSETAMAMSEASWARGAETAPILARAPGPLLVHQSTGKPLVGNVVERRGEQAAARRPGIVRPSSGASARILARAQAPGLAPKEGPCPGDVTFFRAQVAHGQADREPAGQPGVR